MGNNISYNKVILLLCSSIIGIISCNSNDYKERNQVIVDETLFLDKNEVQSVEHFYKNDKEEENSCRVLELKYDIANLHDDTITLTMNEGFFSGHSLRLDITKKSLSSELQSYSCVDIKDFKIDSQQIILNKTFYKVDEELIGRINILAHYSTDEDSTRLSGNQGYNNVYKSIIRISGTFKVKIRDKDFDYDDLHKENVLIKLDTSNISTTKELYLDFCEFDKFPEQATKFRKLEHLSIRGNHIKNIYNACANFPKLKILELANNPITSLHSSIFELSDLRELSLHATNIDKLSANIRKLKKLEYLCISHTKIKELPVEILELKNLKKIALPDTILNQKIVAKLKSRKIEIE